MIIADTRYFINVSNVATFHIRIVQYILQNNPSRQISVIIITVIRNSPSEICASNSVSE